MFCNECQLKLAYWGCNNRNRCQPGRIETIAFRGQLRNGSFFYAKRGAGNFSLAEGRGDNIIYFWWRWGKEDFIRQEEMIFERRGGYADFCFQTA